MRRESRLIAVAVLVPLAVAPGVLLLFAGVSLLHASGTPVVDRPDWYDAWIDFHLSCFTTILYASLGPLHAVAIRSCLARLCPRMTPAAKAAIACASGLLTLVGAGSLVCFQLELWAAV